MCENNCKDCLQTDKMNALKRCLQSPVSLFYFINVVSEACTEEAPVRPEVCNDTSKMANQRAKKSIMERLQNFDMIPACMLDKWVCLLEKASEVMKFDDWQYGAEVLLYELNARAAYV